MGAVVDSALARFD